MAPVPVINLERELDRLFQAPFAEFVGTRNAIASQLKKEGRVDESTRVRGLAKPTYTAWLVNQLYWGARSEFDAFLHAADQVRAHEQGLIEGRKAKGHADALAARDAAIATLLERASARAMEEGTPLSPALRDRLRTTIEAIGAFGSAAARHARGRLQEDLDPPGFAAFAALAAGSKPSPGGARRASPPPEPPRLVMSRGAAVDEEERQAAQEARAALLQAQGEAARAEDAARAAAETERKARTALDAARDRLAEAERALKSAQAEVEATGAALKARQAAARAAAAAATAARKKLERAQKAARRF